MTANQKVILEALERIGVHEYSGKTNNNPLILKWLKALVPTATEDEISWCSAGMYDIVKAALPDADLSNVNASARSWLKYGEATDTPTKGDIVIFWRDTPTSWKGHVSIYIREDDKYIWCLGANQGNSVTTSPYEKSRVLGYRKHIVGND